MIPILGVGAGGHAGVLIEILRRASAYEFAGLVDRDPTLWGTRVHGVNVLGGDDMLPAAYERGIRSAFIGVGGTGRNEPRRDLYASVRRLGFETVSVIHPTAIVASSARLGAAVAVMAGAIVNTSARIGDNVIVNTGAIVEHDCAIDAHAHIATGARLGGGVSVGEGAHVGLGASILQGVVIGAWAVIGAGAVVLADVAPGALVGGVPAKVLR